MLIGLTQQIGKLLFVGLMESNTFPPGEGIISPTSLQTPIFRSFCRAVFLAWVSAGRWQVSVEF